MFVTHGALEASPWRMREMRDMKTIRPVDVHAALARAHAGRAEYYRVALAGLPALLKRLGVGLRPNRRQQRHTSIWA
jgi:hypothetical protein